MMDKNDYVVVENTADYLLITFLGDLDMEIMIKIRPMLQGVIKTLDRPILIDMAKVEFLDSAAVSLLALFFQTAQDKKQTMLIVGTKDQPAAVLEMVGLADYVRILPDLGSAKAALKEAA